MNETSMQAIATRLQMSSLTFEQANQRHHLPAGEPWLGEINAGETVRIVDLEGNQAVDVLFFSRQDPSEHYSATQTMLEQGGIYLTTGSKLMSNLGRSMLSIVADTCGRHDTLGGACSAESNTVRYSLDRKSMHSCRDNFLHAITAAQLGINKRDLAPNINFFMNVPVTAEGGLRFEDGVSAPGKYVELRAEMDVWLLASNCPQLNNPCNAFNPTAVELLIWDK
jgi:urea carboxylase-associated protein 1